MKDPEVCALHYYPIMSIGIAFAGFAAVMGAWISYLATIPRGNVPARPVGTLALQLGGVTLALVAVGNAYQNGAPSAGVWALSGFSVVMGVFFLFLFSQRKVPASKLQVALGDRLLGFEATTSGGQSFCSGSLEGKRVLLKFFRGSW